MLTIEKFKERLGQSNNSDWLHVAVDANNANQFYIVGNGGMGNTISVLIEKFGSDITKAVIDMVADGQLVKTEKSSMLLDQNVSVYYFTKSLINTV